MTTLSSAPDLAQRLERVQRRISDACARTGRDPRGVTLVGISKTFPAEVVAEAVRAGLTNLGENRVQEAVPKAASLATLGLNPTWHLVGHLQTNKVKAALDTFDVIHSVDSSRLLRTIDRAADRTVPVFIEVNVAGESSKQGVHPGELDALLRDATDCPNIEVLGLMTVAPLANNADDVLRPVFRQLASLAATHGLLGLSMGMTGDFEVAIEEGATHVRVGRAIFGERTV